jgi:hypothetical protein
MPNTYPNVILKRGEWSNLYQKLSTVKGSAVTVGTPIYVELVQRGLLHLNVGATEPNSDSGYSVIRDNEDAQNEYGDPGFWAFPPFGDVTVNIREV